MNSSRSGGTQPDGPKLKLDLNFLKSHSQQQHQYNQNQQFRSSVYDLDQKDYQYFQVIENNNDIFNKVLRRIDKNLKLDEELANKPLLSNVRSDNAGENEMLLLNNFRPSERSQKSDNDKIDVDETINEKNLIVRNEDEEFNDELAVNFTFNGEESISDDESEGLDIDDEEEDESIIEESESDDELDSSIDDELENESDELDDEPVEADNLNDIKAVKALLLENSPEYLDKIDEFIEFLKEKITQEDEDNKTKMVKLEEWHQKDLAEETGKEYPQYHVDGQCILDGYRMTHRVRHEIEVVDYEMEISNKRCLYYNFYIEKYEEEKRFFDLREKAETCVKDPFGDLQKAKSIIAKYLTYSIIEDSLVAKEIKRRIDRSNSIQELSELYGQFKTSAKMPNTISVKDHKNDNKDPSEDKNKLMVEGDLDLNLDQSGFNQSDSNWWYVVQFLLGVVLSTGYKGFLDGQWTLTDVVMLAYIFNIAIGLCYKGSVVLGFKDVNTEKPQGYSGTTKYQSGEVKYHYSEENTMRQVLHKVLPLVPFVLQRLKLYGVNYNNLHLDLVSLAAYLGISQLYCQLNGPNAGRKYCESGIVRPFWSVLFVNRIVQEYPDLVRFFYDRSVEYNTVNLALKELVNVMHSLVYGKEKMRTTFSQINYTSYNNNDPFPNIKELLGGKINNKHPVFWLLCEALDGDRTLHQKNKGGEKKDMRIKETFQLNNKRQYRREEVPHKKIIWHKSEGDMEKLQEEGQKVADKMLKIVDDEKMAIYRSVEKNRLLKIEQGILQNMLCVFIPQARLIKMKQEKLITILGSFRKDTSLKSLSSKKAEELQALRDLSYVLDGYIRGLKSSQELSKSMMACSMAASWQKYILAHKFETYKATQGRGDLYGETYVRHNPLQLSPSYKVLLLVSDYLRSAVDFIQERKQCLKRVQGINNVWKKAFSDKNIIEMMSYKDCGEYKIWQEKAIKSYNGLGDGAKYILHQAITMLGGVRLTSMNRNALGLGNAKLIADEEYTRHPNYLEIINEVFKVLCSKECSELSINGKLSNIWDLTLIANFTFAGLPKLTAEEIQDKIKTFKERIVVLVRDIKHSNDVKKERKGIKKKKKIPSKKKKGNDQNKGQKPQRQNQEINLNQKRVREIKTDQIQIAQHVNIAIPNKGEDKSKQPSKINLNQSQIASKQHVIQNQKKNPTEQQIVLKEDTIQTSKFENPERQQEEPFPRSQATRDDEEKKDNAEVKPQKGKRNL